MSNSYKFSEIVLALRETYQKNEKLLRGLEKSLIVRDHDVEIRASVHPGISNPDVNYIRFDLWKKQNKIEKAIEEIKFEVFGIITPGEPHRIVKKENGEYGLAFENLRFFKDYGERAEYHLEFFDKELFDKMADEIMKSDFIKLPRHFKKVNQRFSLTLDTSEISLHSNLHLTRENPFSFIDYLPNTDTLYAIPSKPKEETVLELLDTRIPKEDVPTEYRTIIDSSLGANSKFSRVYIDSPIKRKNEFDIVERPNCFRLVRKR